MPPGCNVWDFQMKQEIQSVEAAAKGMCPLQAVLARVVASSSGVVMAAWQVWAALQRGRNSVLAGYESCRKDTRGYVERPQR